MNVTFKGSCVPPTMVIKSKVITWHRRLPVCLSPAAWTTHLSPEAECSGHSSYRHRRMICHPIRVPCSLCPTYWAAGLGTVTAARGCFCPKHFQDPGWWLMTHQPSLLGICPMWAPWNLSQGATSLPQKLKLPLVLAAHFTCGDPV